MTPQENTHDDHLMNVAEAQLMSQELVEAEMRRALEVMQKEGLPEAQELAAQLEDVVVNRKISQYLMQFTDPVERQSAALRIIQGGLPPEVIAPDDTFVVEGTSTIQ